MKVMSRFGFGTGVIKPVVNTFVEPEMPVRLVAEWKTSGKTSDVAVMSIGEARELAAALLAAAAKAEGRA
jgi:hypothetical protein